MSETGQDRAYRARIVYTMELDGSITRELFGNQDQVEELARKLTPESDQLRSIREARERGDHWPGSDF